MSAQSPHHKSGIKPGVILRAMGAEPGAIAPESFDPPPLHGSPHTLAGSPRVEIVRDGDRVTKILAHCACGEVITIECDYAEVTDDSKTSMEVD